MINGLPKYIGMTGNFRRRRNEWIRGNRAVSEILGDLTRREARALEHLLIEWYGRVGKEAGGILENTNRGIDPRKLGKYTSELDWARGILGGLG
jgi:hypothetical protein